LEADSFNPYDAALAAAREFRVALRNVSQSNGVEIEFGIALHKAPDCLVDIHEALLNTPWGTKVQKSFDTSSTEIDLLHRMESLLHDLPGTCIIASESFLAGVEGKKSDFKELGAVQFKGQTKDVKCHIVLSDLVSSEKFDDFCKTNFSNNKSSKNEAA